MLGQNHRESRANRTLPSRESVATHSRSASEAIAFLVPRDLGLASLSPMLPFAPRGRTRWRRVGREQAESDWPAQRNPPLQGEPAAAERRHCDFSANAARQCGTDDGMVPDNFSLRSWKKRNHEKKLKSSTETALPALRLSLLSCRHFQHCADASLCSFQAVSGDLGKQWHPRATKHPTSHSAIMSNSSRPAHLLRPLRTR